MSAQSNPALAAVDSDDRQVRMMRDLLLRDVAVEDAHLIAFGHPPRPTAPMRVQRLWIRVEARRLGNAAREDLGFPLERDDLQAVAPSSAAALAGMVATAQRLAGSYQLAVKRFTEAARTVAIANVIRAARSRLDDGLVKLDEDLEEHIRASLGLPPRNHNQPHTLVGPS